MNGVVASTLAVLALLVAQLPSCGGETLPACSSAAPTEIGTIADTCSSPRGTCSYYITAGGDSVFVLSVWGSEFGRQTLTILSVPVDGGQASTLYSVSGVFGDVDMPVLLVVGAGGVLFSVFEGPSGISLRRATAKGMVNVLTKNDDFDDAWGGFADSTNIYWAETAAESSRLVKAPQAGGSVTILAELSNDGDLRQFASDAKYAYFEHTYFSDGMPTGVDDIDRVPLAGGPVETIVQHSHEGPWPDIGVAGGRVYVDVEVAPIAGATNGPFEFADVSVNGGSLAKFPPGLFLSAGNVDVDPSGIYAAVFSANSSFATGLVKVPLMGGEVTTIASSSEVVAVATNDTYVFWVDGKRGLLRACK